MNTKDQFPIEQSTKSKFPTQEYAYDTNDKFIGIRVVMPEDNKHFSFTIPILDVRSGGNIRERIKAFTKNVVAWFDPVASKVININRGSKYIKASYSWLGKPYN